MAPWGNTWGGAGDWGKGGWAEGARGQGKGSGCTWGKSKGKGKGCKSKFQDDGDMLEQNTADQTGRIWRRYQLPRALPRASVDPESGPCFVAENKKQRKSDMKMLDDENLLKLLTPSNAHLLRRVGTGLSETAGNIEALIKALATINSFGKAKFTAEDYSKAFDTVATFIKENEEALEKGSIAGMVMHGRGYLGACALRQLIVCVKHPEW
ncbi:unnamed protein product [Prorocentrum cordatum]|uniref:Uncharacterized protein n=1 Tax=Prorocentrum cordatum TaxID=2364126 RepID=A0ABN9WE02_9DINO|nr:unnamed protein product [Polarella glacialis]